MSDQPLLEVRDLKVTVTAKDQQRVLVSGIDLFVRAGESIGIVGESGSGKSVTARSLMGLTPPDMQVSGSVRYAGRELLPSHSGRRLTSDFAMVFQDPFTMLNPLMRSGRHISETLYDERGRRLAGAVAREAELQALAEVGIADPSVAGRYPYELSGGMRQRVGIAATLASNPRVLFADEPTTALDVTTQAEILALLKRVQKAREMAMVLITHDLGVAFEICDRIYVLYAGRLLEHAPAATIARPSLHPYTRGLLDSVPPLDRRVTSLYSMPGAAPRAHTVLDCCPFAARCAWARSVCLNQPVALRSMDETRSSACIRIEEIAAQLVTPPAQDIADPIPVPQQPVPLVEVVNLRKEFHRAGRIVLALDDISIRIAAGESVGIVGESGSGKTTLGRCIIGLEDPSSGSIRVAGVDTTHHHQLSRSEAASLRSHVQMAFQDPYSTLSPMHSIGAALQEAIRLDGNPHPKLASEVNDLLHMVGLPAEYVTRRPRELSGGERQRVALARALARKPKLILCDEIVSALDVSVQAQILNLLTRLRRELGIAYLFITHDLAVVRQITDRVYVLHRGRHVEHGITSEVLDHPRHDYTRKLVASVPERDWNRP